MCVRCAKERSCPKKNKKKKERYIHISKNNPTPVQQELHHIPAVMLDRNVETGLAVLRPQSCTDCNIEKLALVESFSSLLYVV